MGDLFNPPRRIYLEPPLGFKTYVITQIFLEVVGRGKGSEVTTNQPSDIESSQFVSREGSLFQV